MKRLLLAAAITCLTFTPAAYCDSLSEQSLKELADGNRRYVAGQSIHPRIDPQLRRATAIEGQKPTAAILGCADSRVPPEIIFDQGFGQLFVVRVAGNVCGIPELASIEYAVVKLHVPLVVVLGHTQCGAVEAAIANQTLPGSLPELMSMIKPSIDKAMTEKDGHDDLLLRATKLNVYHTIATLLDLSSVIKGAVLAKQVRIVGAIRDLQDGHVDWLPEPKEHPYSPWAANTGRIVLNRF